MSEDQFSALWNPLILTLAVIGLLSLFPEARFAPPAMACVIEKTAHRLTPDGRPETIKVQWVGVGRETVDPVR